MTSKDQFPGNSGHRTQDGRDHELGATRLDRPADDNWSRLAEASLAGHSGAIDSLLAEVRASGLIRQTVAWLRNPADIDEAEQAALIKVRDRLDSFGGQGSLRGWIATVALNEARTLHRRRGQVSRGIPHPEPERISPSWRRFTSAFVGMDLINDAISELPLQQDQVVRLRFDGIPHSEIAELLGIPEGTVRVIFHRARKRLAEYLLAADPDLGPQDFNLTDDEGDE